VACHQKKRVSGLSMKPELFRPIDLKRNQELDFSYRSDFGHDGVRFRHNGFSSQFCGVESLFGPIPAAY
jgi:hypothetical protein